MLFSTIIRDRSYCLSFGAFSLKLRATTQAIGLKPTCYDPEFEFNSNMRSAKHVDDINLTGQEKTLDEYVLKVEAIFGKCKLSKHSFTNCGVRYSKQQPKGNVEMDQDEYIKQLRPITHPELTGTSPTAPSTKLISDMFVSLRGALTYALIAQLWIMVYAVS